MDTDDNDGNKKPPANDDWTPVQNKQKNRPSTEEAIAMPLPLNPPCNPINLQKNPPTLPFFHPQRPPQNPTKPGINYVHVNDGTLRITVRWTPDNFTELTTDENKWNLKATDTIHYILETVPDAILYPWKSTPKTTNLPALDLNPENLLNYLAPTCIQFPPVSQLRPRKVDQRQGHQTEF
jgi:hypothetical protein